MDSIVFLRPSNDLSEAGKIAVEKMKGIFSIDLDVHEIKNSAAADDIISRGGVRVLFCEEVLDKPNINSIVGIIERAKVKPIMIVSSEIYHALKEFLPANILCRLNDFSKSNVFSCLRNLLVPPNQKLDIRYFQSMLKGVIDVVKGNTNEDLTPGKIFEGKNEEETHDFSAVVAFCGDGFLGSATVATSTSLIRLLTIKMLGCEEDDITDEMIEDLLLELANQILGVVRTELAEVGYELKSSMQAVIGGGKHWGVSSSNGTYFSLPFTHGEEKFDFKLCYNTYRVSINEIEQDAVGFGKPLLDIRMLSDVIDLTCSTLESNLSLKISWSEIRQQTTDIYETHSLHLFHAAGFQGTILTALDVPFDTACHILKHMMGMEPEDVTAEMVNDTCGELLNQICGPALSKWAEYGYKMQRVFHGDFAGDGTSKYLLKNPGYYLRVKIDIGGKFIYLCFGMDSQFGDSLFDAWDYYQSIPEFSEKIT